MSKDFSFKRFTVRQESAAFKVGTDSVVLGAWADVSSAKRILDIGTGTGLLALMCAQRNTQALITAIEKDASSVQDADFNIRFSPWSDRIFPVHDTLENYHTETRFDYMITNPPYFLNALLSPDVRKSDARHLSENGFDILADRVGALVAADGIFGCILPEKEFGHLSRLLYKKGWHLNRTQKLWPYPNGNKLRMLAEWTRNAVVHRSMPDLFIRDANGEWHSSYKSLTKDFYLNF